MHSYSAMSVWSFRNKLVPLDSCDPFRRQSSQRCTVTGADLSVPHEKKKNKKNLQGLLIIAKVQHAIFIEQRNVEQFQLYTYFTYILQHGH